VRIEIGPVAATAAHGWTAHMVENLRAIRPQRDRMPFRVPDEVAEAIETLLVRWRDQAADGGDVFHVIEVMDEDEVRSLVRYWANLDSLTDQQVAALGVDWSTPEERPFFDALVAGVARALGDADAAAGAPVRDAFAGLLVDHVGRPVRSAHAVSAA
jgi:hypothetical protein